MTPKTRVEKLMKLYADNEQSPDYLDGRFATVPSSVSVRFCLGVKLSATGATVKKWTNRNFEIGDHLYTRSRDENRAFRANDFTLARALDAQTGGT